MASTSTMMNQFRKPTGWMGRFTLWRMNKSHSKLNDWGLRHVQIGASSRVLDIGCGGGRTVGKLGALAQQGKVYGIDHSQDSVAASTRTNARLIEAGPVEVTASRCVSVAVFRQHVRPRAAAETHFFWPNLPGDMREILRVLMPGGTLLIIAEVYKSANTRVSRVCATVGDDAPQRE